MQRGLLLPDLSGLQHGSRWAVTMVKNEIDIIEQTLRHLVNQDVDEILVADNGSSDGTLERLRELSHELPLHVALDNEPRYFQAAKMTALSQAAGRAGAAWVLPFDADEFWFAQGKSVGQFLRSTDAGVITARLFNVFPKEAGTVWRLDPQAGDLPKVAFRPHRLARLSVGNHWITHPGRPESGLYIAHYPWRSPEQLRLKTSQGAQALTAKQRAEGIGWHWTAAADAADAWVEEAWSAIEHGTAFEYLHWTPSGRPLWDVDPRQHDTWMGPTG